MLNITDLQQEEKVFPLFRLGFRPLFLFGGLFAVVAIGFWTLFLQGVVTGFSQRDPFWWHAHEMLFGFTTAIIVGFLLTAVQNWTGIPGLKSTRLMLLFALWLSARVLLFMGTTVPIAWTMSIDLLFLPLAAYFLARPIIRIKQYRNLIFVPILLLMTLTNAASYLPGLGFAPTWQQQSFYGMVLLTIVLISLLGGRVIPFFTANGTGQPKVAPWLWLEVVCALTLVCVFVLYFSGWAATFRLLPALLFLAAVAQFIRWFRWRPWVTINIPLLWSLHLAYSFVPVGLLLLGLSTVSAHVSQSAALHALNTGAIGGMILAMMARVSLGHTGRKLVVSKGIAVAFGAVLLAGLVRSILVAGAPQFVSLWWQISGGLWCIGFALFVVRYWPILTRPRLDGRPG
ncbi:NnrS family protein [Aestuariibacter halophilus]|uniref:NnrS family protein n=1 Tax=Fluctibacter halophilus TaxID=226011 RepID=A0ABS8G3J5_9ALTE|nr:NnrS family protein [Aestuariibacter halophilus]MCC2615053.1 NnrS family protein [Aestuariibacter halophilus]